MTPLFLAIAMLAQPQSPAQSGGTKPAEEAAARLEFMKKSVSIHKLKPAGDPTITFRISPEPAMRFTNTVGTVTDGSIFFWLDAEDRPVAAVQVYRIRSGSWHHAFSSLSTFRLSAGPVWNPSGAGVEFKPVPGAAAPAATPEQRLRQMRELLGGFKAEMNLELKTWHNLRSLTKPLFRYGKPDSDVTDGAVFGFVLTTDPEVYLLLEARRAKNGLSWQYAFAPEASAPIRATWKGKDAWSFEFDSSSNHSRAAYYDWTFGQDP